MRGLERPSSCHNPKYKDPVSDTHFCMSKQVYKTLSLLSYHTYWTSRQSAVIIHFAAEAWNHAN